MKQAYFAPAFLTAIVISISTAPAAPPQAGLAYYSDVHGAAALVRCMHAVSRFDRSYVQYRDAGMKWMLQQIRDFPSEGRTWLQNPSAPKELANYHTTVTVAANFNALTALEVYQETKDPALLKVVQEHFDWLKNTAHQKHPAEGDAYFWTSKHSIDPPKNAAKPRPLMSGNSWGFGNILDAFVEYYRVTGDESVLPYLERGVRFAYLASEKSAGDAAASDEKKRRGIAPPDTGGLTGGAERIHWKRYGGDTVMGFCRGISGSIYAVQAAQQTIPGAKIAGDGTIEDVINAGLRFIIDDAIRQEETAIWNNMNGRPGERNLGLGRGVSGIALTLWRGYKMNLETGNEEMAQLCRETAEATIATVLEEVESLEPGEALSEYVARDAPSDDSGRVVETIGWCSGISGSYRWMLMYAGDVRGENPELARRCEEAARTIAYRLINTAFVVDGAYAWKNHNPKFGGERFVNMAVDHGQTGVVCALAEVGLALQDEKIMAAARKGADYVVQTLVNEGDAVKMPFLVRIDPAAKPLKPRDSE